MNKQTRTRNAQGFSLVELMVVVAIIGILSAIAIPNYQRFQRKAKQSEAKGTLSGIYLANSAFRQEYDCFISDFARMGFRPEGNYLYNTGWDTATPGAVGVCLTGFDTVNTTGSEIYSVCDLPTAVNANTICTRDAAVPAATNGTGCASTITNANNAEDTFTACAHGVIGGVQNDVWSMTSAKTLTNVTPGL